MFFERVKTPGIAHVAYVVGSNGEAAVVDPRRDVDAYVAIARDAGLTITSVVETHRQEDFVIGSREIARLTGARIVSGDHGLFGHSHVRLRDGEEFHVGQLTFRALHTPGHTPESTCYAVYLPNAADRAWGVFTGDTLFIGETGRTDLTDPGRTRENAGLLYDVVHRKLLPLGDQALVLPAHGSGSVCGSGIANRDHSTLGLERSTNPVFTMTRDAFMAHKENERIPRPPYFRRMEQVNLQGGLSNITAAAVPLMQPKRFQAEMASGIVIDTRTPEAFAGGHIPGSLSIWLSGLPIFGGWVADERTPVFLVLDDVAALERAVLSLARIGVDGIAGVLAGGFEHWRDAGLPIDHAGVTTPRALESQQDRPSVLDVREISEFEEQGHIAGAQHCYVGFLPNQLDALPPPLHAEEPVVVTCSVGHRASLAVSILKRHGFKHVSNLLGGMKAWSALKLPVDTGARELVSR